MKPTDHTASRQSIWAATVQRPLFPPLQGDTRAEVCIVGAGIAGLATAYELVQAGKTVVVLEDGPLAGGMTEMTTAHLTCAIDNRYLALERWHGPEGSRLAARSHSAAIDRIEEIAAKEGIDCDFLRVDGYLFAPPGQPDDLLRQEMEAAHRAGLTEVRMVDRAPFTSFESGPALLFPRQGQFHPLKYLRGLAQAIAREGGRIFCGTHADGVEGGDNARVTAGEYTVRGDAVVVATNPPINDLVVLHTKQAGYTTYVIGAQVPPGHVEWALYWDTADPYHYVRLQTVQEEGQEPYELLIVGGEDHKSGQAKDAGQHRRLEAWARERFPAMGEVAFAWAGEVMETTDGLAFIGHNPLDKDNMFVATGDSGMGMTHGTIAGMLLKDLIVGRENPWAKLYDPSRITLKASDTYARETLNMVAQYGDWFTGGDVNSEDEIEKGQGALLRHGLGKIAAYRDETGSLRELSATCRHLGCIVHWNTAMKTWDCPCHGSRYSASGEVVMGPANRNLPPAGES